MDLDLGVDRVVTAGREFFRQGFEVLGFELRDRVLQAVSERVYLGPESRRATAGTVSAGCDVEYLDDNGRKHDRIMMFTPKKFEKVLELLEWNPIGAGLDMFTWGHRNGGMNRVEPDMTISWYRNTTSWASPLPNWVILDLISTYDFLLGTAERQRAVVDFVRDVAGPANPACGEVSFETQSGDAPLPHLLPGRDRRRAVAESRSVVRSYSWVTVISEEIGQRLGGEAALAASGAFYRVDHLGGGGFMLQATERFEQYQREQAYRVFRVLAPALPPGTPRAPAVYPPGYPKDDEPDFMIIQEDPSTVQTA